MKSIRISVCLAPVIVVLASCAVSPPKGSTQPAGNPAPIARPSTLTSAVVSRGPSGIRDGPILGHMFQFGIGVPIDYKLAMACYHRAADAGDVKAMTDIAFLYEYGLGVEQDYVQAMAWYLPAADVGDVVAMNEIGCLYAYGRGVARDFTEAISWWKKAADEGDVSSMYELGLVYDLGVAPAAADPLSPRSPDPRPGVQPDPRAGVQPDPKEAVQWYIRAAAHGDPNAKKRLLEMQAD